MLASSWQRTQAGSDQPTPSPSSPFPRVGICGACICVKRVAICEVASCSRVPTNSLNFAGAGRFQRRDTPVRDRAGIGGTLTLASWRQLQGLLPGEKARAGAG